jgi:hypothetical protein
MTHRAPMVVDRLFASVRDCGDAGVGALLATTFAALYSQRQVARVNNRVRYHDVVRYFRYWDISMGSLLARDRFPSWSLSK